MNDAQAFRVGVTLHSFTHEFNSFQWSFEDMMQLAARLGGGVEIVGPAHHRCFPEVSDEFERTFKSAVERHGLTPTSYGSYADPFMLADRDLNADELVDYTALQLHGAAKLGFPVVRLQYFVAPVVERLLPLAEELGLRMGYELHAPLTINSKKTLGLLAQVQRINSPILGLIPDAGIFARSIPKFLIDEARARKVPDALISQALELWRTDVPLSEAQERLRASGADMRQFVTLERFWGSFGRSDPAALAQIMAHVIHFHGKFFSMESGDEPDIRYRDLVHVLMRLGYRGWMSSEYEGPDTDSFAIVSEHQAMIHRYIGEYRRGARAG